MPRTGDSTIKIYVMWYVREMRKVITSVLKKGKYKYAYVGKGKEGRGFGGSSDAAFYVDFVSQKDFDKIKKAIDDTLEKDGWTPGMNYDMYFSESEELGMNAETLIDAVAAGQDPLEALEEQGMYHARARFQTDSDLEDAAAALRSQGLDSPKDFKISGNVLMVTKGSMDKAKAVVKKYHGRIS